RKTSTSPYPSLVPYHSCNRNDALPFQKGKVARLDIGMQPVSFLIQKNHKIRIAIAGADKDHFEIVPSDGTVPEITLHHSTTYPSRVDLPVLENK
ncbi:hydrolase, partial [bacterium]|nr:hydrolase [bacterium]